MDRTNMIEQREIGDYRITIFRDDYPMCPVTHNDLCGLFLWENCEYGGVRLSSLSNTDELSCDPHSLEDALRDLVCKYVPQKKITDYINSSASHNFFFKYDNSSKIWQLFSLCVSNGECSLLNLFPNEFHNKDMREEICEFLGEDDFKYLLQYCQKEIAYTEFSTSGYCQRDYAEGIAYCDIERFKKICDTDTKNWRKRAVEIMDEEVNTLGKWMWGDVYGFVLEKKEEFHKTYINSDKTDYDDEEWDEIESCYGYYEEPNEIIQMVINEHNLSPKSAA